MTNDPELVVEMTGFYVSRAFANAVREGTVPNISYGTLSKTPDLDKELCTIAVFVARDPEAQKVSNLI